jgi:beta-aspartyl-peptidase (threonine type)
VRNPITLARRVLESQVVLLVGQGAERFAESAGVSLCDPAELLVERERQRWASLRKQAGYRAQDAFGATRDEGGRQSEDALTHSPSSSHASSSDRPLSHPGDTVGAVALDRYGHLAAGTSTGGTANKLPGRVGDSPLIGCGLYADDQTGGCSSTGWGESIIKVLLAKTATDQIGAGYDPMAAAQMAIDILQRRVGGLGGCILLDSAGHVGFAFNTPRMAYAYRAADGRQIVGI